MIYSQQLRRHQRNEVTKLVYTHFTDLFSLGDNLTTADRKSVLRRSRSALLRFLK